MAATMHAEAVRALCSGQAVIFPTDTVYGLGVAVRYAGSPQILFDIKRRAAGKPVAWLVSSPDDLREYGQNVPDYTFDLAKEFWPGGLTLVVKTNSDAPSAFVSQAGTVGLRMPDHAGALALIRDVGCPLATTSANISSQAAPATATDIDPQVAQCVPVVLADDSDVSSGTASTVIDCTDSIPVILRTGDITPDDVFSATGLVPEVIG